MTKDLHNPDIWAEYIALACLVIEHIGQGSNDILDFLQEELYAMETEHLDALFERARIRLYGLPPLG